MRNRSKLWTRNGSRLWDQKSNEKHASTLHFLCFESLTCLVWWGKIKKFEKKTLLGHLWIAQSMDFIFPILNGYRPKSRGFWTITREPQTQISCFLVLIALFWWVTDENKTKTSISQKEIIFKGVQRQDFQNCSGRPKYLNLYA